MYQSRSKDLDPRVGKIGHEGAELLKALHVIEGSLSELEDLDQKYVEVKFHVFSRTTEPIDLSRVPDSLSKEIGESKQKLDQSCLDAFITLLEAEREDIIKKYNNLMKLK